MYGINGNGSDAGDDGATQDAAAPSVNGLLSGSRWKSYVQTYSFPKAEAAYGYADSSYSHFRGLTGAQQNAVTEVLKDYSSFSNLKFIKLAGAAAGNAAIRVAQADHNETAYAFYPSQTESGGDVWFNTSSKYYKSPVKGSYAYYTFVHELGHALGLKHAHEGGTHGKIAASQNGMPFTVMTYASYVGAKITGTLTNAHDSYAQSAMLDDIAAIQKLYGANYASHNGNTMYKWDALTGQEFIDGVGQGKPVGNKVFQTVWDGGGNDTYDFSNYAANLKINLNPGKWTKLADEQTAVLSSKSHILAPGNIANAYLYKNNPASLIENATGGGGNDSIVGNIAANVLKGGAGNDALNGFKGNDILFGGSGDDAFVFRAGFGHDTIGDFHDGNFDPAISHGDTLDLRGLGLASFQDMLNHTADTKAGALITVDAADTILLSGVTKSQLASLSSHSDGFLFV